MPWTIRTYAMAALFTLTLGHADKAASQQALGAVNLLNVARAQAGPTSEAAPAPTLNPEFLALIPPLVAEATADGAPATELRVNFNTVPAASSNATSIGVVRRVSRPGGEAIVLHGDLQDGHGGEFTVTIVGDRVVARILAPQGWYVVHPEDGTGYTTRTPSDLEEDEAHPIPALERGKRPRRAPVTRFPMVEDGSRIDVLIAYTTATKDRHGREKVVLAAREAEANMNVALAQSLPGAPPSRIRLVDIVEVPNSVPPYIGQMLNNDTLKDLRHRHRADLVIVFHHRKLNYPGKAFIYQGNPVAGRKRAYGVVRHDAIFWQKMTTVHELGHLFGAAHDPDHARASWEPHMRAHIIHAREPDGTRKRWGTIMAYSRDRLKHFSNPAVHYHGVATGKADRNNADAIKRSRQILANYYVNTDDVNPDGPLIAYLQPEQGAHLPPNSQVTVEARIADGDGVNKAELFWEHSGNHLPCPGSGRGWSCSMAGDRYLWAINVGPPGSRAFRVRAADAKGHVTTASLRAIEIVDREVYGPLIEIQRPEPNAQLPAGSKINVIARVADGDGVSAVELDWRHTNRRFRCPGTDNKDWTCTQVGDVYTWTIRVGSGPRTFAVEAIDQQGNKAASALRTIVLK